MASLRRFGPTALAATLLCLAPELADACTVCMGGQEEASRKAFVGTTAFLTFFPLLILAIGVTLFVRRVLAREQAEAEEARVTHRAQVGQPIR